MSVELSRMVFIRVCVPYNNSLGYTFLRVIFYIYILFDNKKVIIIETIVTIYWIPSRVKGYANHYPF